MRRRRRPSRAAVRAAFEAWLLASGFVAEVRVHPTRRFRFDYAHTGARVAVEIDGGVYRGGRHVRGAGFERDCVKCNLATANGWRVFRVTPGLLGTAEGATLRAQLSGLLAAAPLGPLATWPHHHGGGADSEPPSGESAPADLDRRCGPHHPGGHAFARYAPGAWCYCGRARVTA